MSSVLWLLRKKMKTLKNITLQRKMKILVILFTLYIIYQSIRVYQFLKHHDKYVANIVKRAKKRKYKTIPAWLNFSYDEMVTQEQFDKNMKYFEKHRNKNGGFIETDNAAFKQFAESCTFLGGARAALLQVTHPMVAIAVKKQSYIFKGMMKGKGFKSKNKNIAQCPFEALSKALKVRFMRTFAVMLPIGFGPLNVSLIGAKKAWQMHKSIHGYIQTEDDKEIIGDGKIFNANTYYSATMVLTTTWVWATLIEGTIFINQMMGNLSYDETDQENNKLIEQMYQLSISNAMAFGLRPDQTPTTYKEFEEYFYYHMMHSNHLIVTNDCANWCKVFFMAHKWRLKPLVFAMQSYTALLFPKTVRDKFDACDKSLLPLNRFRYIYGLLWMGLSRGVYAAFPKDFRYLNNYIDLQQRMNDGKISVHTNVMKQISQFAADRLIQEFFE